jgi:hypothetical protein
MEIPGARVGTRCTQVHVSTVEDRYVLLVIQYMIIFVLHGSAVGGVVSILSLLRSMFSYHMICLKGTPAWLCIRNQARVY